MRNIDVIVHDEFVGVVLTFFYCIKLIDVDLMFPTMVYTSY